MCIQEHVTQYLDVHCPICSKFCVHRLDVSHIYKGEILIHFYYFIFDKTNNYNKTAIPYPDPPSFDICHYTTSEFHFKLSFKLPRYNFTIHCNYSIYLIHLHSNS